MARLQVAENNDHVIQWKNLETGKTGTSKKMTKEDAERLCKTANKDFTRAHHEVICVAK